MITVNEALKIVQNTIVPMNIVESKNVSDAFSYILYDDIVSPINMPPFRQSAMDGYALRLHDGLNYSIIDEVKAGDDHKPKLNKGEGVRIFTGAAVPDTANAVVMQEKVSVNNQFILTESTITSNQNIRALGEQVMRGQIALKKGTKITSAAIGYLSSLGISEINVFKKPTVGIVVTGNELIEPGELLTYGKIYESNAAMLHSTLKNLGYNEISIHKVDDDYQNTLKTLSKVLMEYDVILISGGISVGDYDFVGKALRELDVDQLFYKVKQKPGKPLFFGKTEKSIVFALPGNPGAALSCFYIYVYKTLQKMSGDIDFSLPRTSARCQTNFTKKGERAQFIKAIYKNGEVTLLDGQSSSMLHTFALANALVHISETTNSIEINDMVETILLPLN